MPPQPYSAESEPLNANLIADVAFDTTGTFCNFEEFASDTHEPRLYPINQTQHAIVSGGSAIAYNHLDPYLLQVHSATEEHAPRQESYLLRISHECHDTWSNHGQPSSAPLQDHVSLTVSPADPRATGNSHAVTDSYSTSSLSNTSAQVLGGDTPSDAEPELKYVI